MQDTIENYETHAAPSHYLLQSERDAGVPTPPYHKHIVGQDDRFCPASGFDSFSSIFVYYRCLPGFGGSMTVWDIVTVLFLCIPYFDVLSDSHVELMEQVMVPLHSSLVTHVSSCGCCCCC